MTEVLAFQGNDTEPTVVFDPENGTFRISGRSMMDNADIFYKELLVWLNEFKEDPTDVDLTIDMECFNIASSKRILFLLYKLEEIHKEKNVAVSVTWCHNNNEDDMLELGQDFAFMVKIPFIFSIHHLEEPAQVS